MENFKESPLPHFNERPIGVVIDTIVIHSIYSTEGTDPFSPHSCIALLDTHCVAAHYLITRSGEIIRLVPDECRAWHAGKSCMPFSDDSRTEVNDFSIGIELVATESSGFTEAQYMSLSKLTKSLLARHPVRSIVGHDQIAPDRKTDPGPLFDWTRFRSLVSDPRCRFLT